MPNIYLSWSTSELRVRLARRDTGLSPPVKYFTARSKAVLLLWIFYVFFSVLCLLCLCVRLFVCAFRSPAGKGLTSWLSFVASKCEFVTFPLVSWVRCGTWLYRFLIFAPLLTKHLAHSNLDTIKNGLSWFTAKMLIFKNHPYFTVTILVGKDVNVKRGNVIIPTQCLRFWLVRWQNLIVFTVRYKPMHMNIWDLPWFHSAKIVFIITNCT